MTITIDKIALGLKRAYDKGDMETAKKLGIALKEAQGKGISNEQRINEAFDDSRDVRVERGGILPVSQLVRNDGTAASPVGFDSDAGLVGAIKQAVMLPGDVASGKTSITDANGRVSDEVIGRSFDLAGTAAPMGVASKASAVRTLPAVKKELPADAVSRIKDAQRFGVDLSEGQALRTQALQAREEDILKGVSGDRAQQVISNQRGLQEDQIKAAARQLQDEIAPGTVEAPREAGDLIRDAVTGKTQSIKAASQQAFKNVENSTAEIKREAIPKLVQSIDNKLTEEFGRDNLNQFKAVTNSLKELQQLFDNPAAAASPGIPWKRIQSIRSRIVNNTNPATPEGAAMQAMRQSLDDGLDDIVVNGLVSGDKAALSELKKARGLWSQYKGILKNPNLAIRKIADGSLDGSQVANLIIGAGQVGNKQAGASIVREIKKLVGKNHSSIAELKRSVITRLLNDTAQGDIKTFGKLASDINKFTSNDAPELALELFGKDGLKALRQFSGVLRSATTDSIAQNPSSSGQAASRIFNGFLRENAALLGFAAGDFIGILAGLGLRGVRDRKAIGEAKRLITTPSVIPKVVRPERQVGSRYAPLAIPTTSQALPRVEAPKQPSSILF